jgi:hypothetical protein
MGMRYTSPPLPVDLAFVQRNTNIGTATAAASTANDGSINAPPIANTDTNSELGAKIAAAMTTANTNYNEDVSARQYKEVAAIFNKN